MSGRQHDGRNRVSADRLAHYSVPPEKKHAGSLHNRKHPTSPSSCLHLSESNWPVVSYISTEVVLRQGWFIIDLQISPIFWTGEWCLTSTGFNSKDKQHQRGKNASSYLIHSVLVVAIRISKVESVCLLLNRRKTPGTLDNV